MSRRKPKAQSYEAAPDVVSAKPATAKELFAAIENNGLIGMWKDRNDIGRSSKFARELRKQASQRKGDR